MLQIQVNQILDDLAAVEGNATHSERMQSLVPVVRMATETVLVAVQVFRQICLRFHTFLFNLRHARGGALAIPQLQQAMT